MDAAQMMVVHRLLRETGERTRKNFESLGIEAGPLEVMTVSAAMLGEMIEQAEAETKETLTKTISQLLTGLREVVDEGAAKARNNPLMEMLAKLGLMEGIGPDAQRGRPPEDEKHEEFEFKEDHHHEEGEEGEEEETQHHANCEHCPISTPTDYRERTQEEVSAALGREATMFEFRSANCKCVGERPAHANCGWCPEHDRPRCDCKCEAVYAVNEAANGG